MKLKRDLVVSVTERGSIVGVYDDTSTCSCEPLFECDSQLADKLIRLWNDSEYALLWHD